RKHTPVHLRLIDGLTRPHLHAGARIDVLQRLPRLRRRLTNAECPNRGHSRENFSNQPTFFRVNHVAHLQIHKETASVAPDAAGPWFARACAEGLMTLTAASLSPVLAILFGLLI